MKINFSVPASTRPTGGPILVYSLANALQRRGHDVCLIHTALFGGVYNETLASSYPRSSSEIGYFEFDEEVEHRFLPDPLADPSAVPDADVMVKGNEEFPDRCGTPVILIQGTGVFAPELERAVLDSEGLKVCVSGWLRTHLIDQGLDPSEVLHLPVGLDHDVFSAPACEASRVIDVAMAYNEWPTKGAETGIAALSLVRKSHPDLEVVLFGTYPMVHLVPPWMTYMEGLRPAQLASEVFSRSRIMLNPSRIEGFGLTSVESMACGCALVTASNRGSDEFAFHGETAMVVDGTDVDAMAGAIQELLEDPGLCTRLTTSGTEFTRTLRWERSAEAFDNFLRARLALRN